MDSDKDLMLRAQSGDLDKVGVLYKRYNKMLFGYFFRITCNTEVSEDLVQVVFFRVVKYRDRFRGEGKFTSWMYSIAHNALSDHFRKNSKTNFHLDINDIDIAGTDDIDTEIVGKNQQDILKKALNQLSSEQREALILKKYQDLKYKEIAEILNCTENVVKARVFRAIKKLKEIISEFEKGK